MRTQEQWLELLERQATAIDGLERYISACDRRGSTDDLAVSARDQAVRLHRKTLASTPVDVLFLYGMKVGQAQHT